MLKGPAYAGPFFALDSSPDGAQRNPEKGYCVARYEASAHGASEFATTVLRPRRLAS
jgi:hypothetical protein